MSRDCVLGLDCGTQSAKAGIWTLDGEPVSRGSSPLEVLSPHPGWAEQDPRRWWTSACEAIRKACAGTDSSRIVALGVAWQRESFALLGPDGEPLRPGILWLDIRAHAEVAARAGEAEILHAETGKPLDVTTTLPRLDWLRTHEPDLFRAVPRWSDVGCWLFERLVGRRATCVAGADTTGMISLETGTWSEKVLSRAGLQTSDMPQLLEPGAVVGRLTRAAAGDSGLPPGIPVVAAGGDGQVFATGLGAVGVGASCTLTLGTSVVLGVPARGPSISGSYRTLFAARPDRSYLLEAVIQSGTYLLRWLEEAFCGRAARGTAPDLAALEEEASRVPPGSEGLVTVPHWWGTRFPSPRPEARGITLGWSHRHGLAHLHRSLLEGVAFELKHCSAAMASILPGGLPARVVAGGGGASSRLWRTIIADTLGCELGIMQDPEPVALGAALLAGTGAGLVAGMEEAVRRFVRPGEMQAPDPGRAAFIDRVYREVYVPLREAGMQMSARLAALA
jgi:xylulokinase